MKKRVLAVMLIVSLLLVGACASALADGTWLAGSYSASAKGFGGDVTVTVTVDAAGVTAVDIVGEGETPALGGTAMEKLSEAILAAQSAEVDGVTGATITSTAVKAAAAQAMAMA